MTTDDIAADMADLLSRAAIWLRGYEALHRAKGTPESEIKAVTNCHRAEEIETLVKRYETFVSTEQLQQPQLPLPPVSDGRTSDMFGWRSNEL